MSAEVVWQCIKNGNAFLRKGSNNRGDPIFSSEPGNLLARHSFKHSGLANAKTLHIAEAVGDKLRVTLTKTSAKSAGKPAKRAAASVINAVSRRKVTKAAAAEASKFRPDLKDAAIRRASAVQKALRVRKAASKATKELAV